MSPGPRARRLLAAATAYGVIALPGGGAAEPARCPEPFGGLPSPELTYFVATARSDTLPAPVDPVSAGDAAADVFGQVVEVERAGGADADRLAGRGEHPTAVLIPWGFDRSCRPIAWTGSWRWAEVGAEGFYRGRLRPREEWVEGMPTLDVYDAVWEGFPVSPWEHPFAAGRPGLSAAQLFDLYDRLPTAASVVSRPYGAVAELVEWRRHAGELADRYPARALLTNAFRVAEVARLRSSPLPFAGTYRMRLEANGDELAQFFLRTGPVGEFPLPDAEETATVPAAPAPARVFAMPASLAAAERRLAVEDETARTECTRAAGIRVVTPREDQTGSGTRAWPAELSPRFVAACFRGAALLERLQATEPTGDAGIPEEGYEGEFRQEADGRFTFRQPGRLPDGDSVMLTGERVDLRTLPGPDPVVAEIP